jgi:hypothetical protein
MLSEEDKLDMVQAICTYLCVRQRKKVAVIVVFKVNLAYIHAGFWVDGLMEVHNAFWGYYHDQKQEEELQKDIKNLQDFTET